MCAVQVGLIVGKMMGDRATLEDIVLSAFGLNLNESDTEEALEGEKKADPYETFRVGLCCAICDKQLRFVTRSTASGIRQLESLLVEDRVKFVCYGCVKQHGLN